MVLLKIILKKMLAARWVKAGASAPLQHVSAKSRTSPRVHNKFHTRRVHRSDKSSARTVLAGLQQSRIHHSNFSTSNAIPDHGKPTTPSFVVSSDWERFGSDLASATSEFEARGPLEPLVAKFFTSGDLPQGEDLYGFDSSFAAEYIQDEPERNLYKTMDDLIRANIQREILLKAARLDQA